MYITPYLLNEKSSEMYKTVKWVSEIAEGLQSILFPPVCLSCGVRKSSMQLCHYCMNHRFTLANLEFQRTTGDSLLPDGVVFQYALWLFDKQGILQDLLHRLKYNHLRNIGIQMGRQLGRYLRKHPHYLSLTESGTKQPVLVPVPLHSARYRRRGYNQAWVITEGVADELKAEIVKHGYILRSKNTRTQTGFSMQKRLKNIKSAFKVMHPEMIENRAIIIVDDVFTTGATTFELARLLLNYKPKQLAIATVAQA